MRFRDHRVVGDILELARALPRRRRGRARVLRHHRQPGGPLRRPQLGQRASQRVLDIPFCVAGGIRSVADAEDVLNAGADKISVNSPALADPGLIDELAARFGSQCVVVGIDSQTVGRRATSSTSSPATRTARATRRADTLDWVREVAGPRRRRDRAQLHGQRRRAPGLRHRAAAAGARRLPRAADRLGRRRRAGALRRRVRARARVDGALAASVFHSGAIAIPRPQAATCAHRQHGGATMTPDRPRTTGLGQGRRPAARHRAGRAHRPRADARLHERGALQQTLASGTRRVLQPHAAAAVDKGETSGHFLDVVDVSADCDSDAILRARRCRAGPTCHNGTRHCFAAARPTDVAAIRASSPMLEATIAQRMRRTARRQLHRAAARRRGRAASRRRSARKASRRRSRRSRATTPGCSASAPTCSTTCWCCSSRAISTSAMSSQRARHAQGTWRRGLISRARYPATRDHQQRPAAAVTSGRRR